MLADKFFFEHLAHVVLDPRHRVTDSGEMSSRSPMEETILDVAKVLRALRECVSDLETHYKGLPRPPTPIDTLTPSTSLSSSTSTSHRHGKHNKSSPRNSHSPLGMFPRWKKFKSNFSGATETYTVEYVRRLTDCFGKPVFLAKMYCDSDGQNEKGDLDVVVKFAYRYCAEAHRILAAKDLAPKLYYAAYEGGDLSSPKGFRPDDEPGMHVVVMKYFEDSKTAPRDLSTRQKEKLTAAVTALHNAGFAFGDLRCPNILVRKDDLYLVDFDWCGRPNDSLRYPLNIRTNGIRWHEGVGPGQTIELEHDTCRLARMLEGETDNY